MAVTLKHLGKGINFPFRITTVGESKRGVDFAEGEEKVVQSIRRILFTPLKDRPVRRDFGSDFWNLVFEPLDETFLARIQDATIEAIDRWEPRVNVIDVQVNINEKEIDRVDIFIQIQFKRTQSIGNLVFPFFLNEFGKREIGEAQVTNVFGTAA